MIWSKQIEEVVSKTRSMSGWTLRTFRTREREPMTTIWNSLVRPNLDYCSLLWAPSPSNYGEIDMLEDTQRSFIRNVNGMKGLDCAQRLKKLKMYSIQRRHVRYKILYIYKIKEKLIPNGTQSHGLYLVYGRYGCECK